jgi:hypothetical protein
VIRVHLEQRSSKIYEPVVVELDGPPMKAFEIPLDFWATANGELEREGHPDAARLTQRVLYHDFEVDDVLKVRTITDRVTARLKELGGGYLWWRQRPDQARTKLWWLRLGTSPELPPAWWGSLSNDVENTALD